MTQKIAVDSSATEYWKTYFGSYGEQLVKDILKKVAETIVAESALKTAEKVRVSLRPLASTKVGQALIVEGTLAASDGAAKHIAAFRARITGGKVEEVKTASLRS